MGVLADLTAAEIERIEQAKADIRAALNAKGLTCGSSRKIDKYAEVIESAVVFSASNVTITNNKVNSEKQLPIVIAYTNTAGAVTTAVIAVGESITIETLKNSAIIAGAAGDTQLMATQHTSGVMLYAQSSNGTETKFSSPLVAVFSATDATGEYSVYWA